ncbi:Glucose/galactose transporter [Vanrija pseudolonga]|uniref:Glucose/galactose transporter n=1 Tax=Vanrija pseudolonga TaxID=143232 RepID=A0AAF1BUG6_9TREE|nr:Glucose/galactose transporter [Vanrija pseudolonga]
MPGGAAAPIAGNVFKEGLFPRHYFVAFVLVTSLFFLWGFAYGLLDVLNSHFRSTLHITKLQSTGLQVAYFGWGYFAFSPVAGEVMRRKGYKFTILMGLFFYSLGAIFFWPCAKFSDTASNKHAVFGGFVICTGVTAMGLASLEVAANSYIAVMPPVSVSSLRLQLSQSFNGVASFAGPLIASKYFFSGKNAGSNTNVQWVYLAVAGMGALIAVCFVFVKLPEVDEADLFGDEQDASVRKPLWKETRATTGAIAQFLYVGAQVTIGAFFLFYVEENAGISQARGAQLLSYALIMFTVARFISTALLSVVAAPVLLGIYAVLATLCTILVATLHGNGGVAMIMLVMFFESIMYPVIFTLATQNLGFNTRRAAALVVMGVSGGAVFPPIQGAISDRHGTRVSFWLVVPCFVYIALWALYIWNKDGRYFSPLQQRKDAGAWEENSVANDDEKATGNAVIVEEAGKAKW